MTRQIRFDWLRTIVILNLIPFHAAWLIISVPGFSQVSQDTIVAELLGLYLILIAPLHMPLLFTVAGYSSAASLEKRGSLIIYLRERFQRLVIPLLTFMLILFPLLSYYWPTYQGERNLVHYLLKFWPYMLTIVHYNPGTKGPGWAHLWFVGYLIIMTLMTLPIFLYLQTKKIESGGREKWAIIPSRLVLLIPALFFIFCFIPLAVIFPFYQNGNLYSDWGYFSYNLTAFLLGYFLYHNRGFLGTIEQHLFLWLFLLVLSTTLRLTIAFQMGAYLPENTSPEFNLSYFAYSATAGLSTWSWIAFTLAMVKRKFNFSHKFIQYLKRSSYSYYILHFVIMVVVGHFLTEWNLNLLTEFLALSAMTFAGTALTYEFLLKRWFLTRWAFGIKDQK